MNKGILKKCIAVFLSVAVLATMSCVPCFAGVAETCTNISGSTAATKSFKVTVNPKTYGYDYIKLTHKNKGYFRYEWKAFGVWSGNHKFKNHYGYYTVTIQDCSTGKTVKTVAWKNAKSVKLNFGSWFKYKGSQFQQKTYLVTVQPYSYSKMRKEAHYGFEYWYTHANWYLLKTRGVSTCY